MKKIKTQIANAVSVLQIAKQAWSADSVVIKDGPMTSTWTKED